MVQIHAHIIYCNMLSGLHNHCYSWIHLEKWCKSIPISCVATICSLDYIIHWVPVRPVLSPNPEADPFASNLTLLGYMQMHVHDHRPQRCQVWEDARARGLWESLLKFPPSSGARKWWGEGRRPTPIPLPLLHPNAWEERAVDPDLGWRARWGYSMGEEDTL